MTNNELDRVLVSKDDDILPSSGFVASVMEAVRVEAIAPPPISFPWKRALPGLAASCVGIVWLIIAVATAHLGSEGAEVHIAVLPSVLSRTLDAAACGILALLASVVSLTLAMRLAAR